MHFARKKNPELIILAIAPSIEEALKLYEEGANYVILPHFIGGHYASEIAKHHGFDKRKFNAERDKHIKYLSQRKELGHEKALVHYYPM